jgi:hypothetical protein
VHCSARTSAAEPAFNEWLSAIECFKELLVWFAQIRRELRQKDNDRC